MKKYVVLLILLFGLSLAGCRRAPGGTQAPADPDGQPTQQSALPGPGAVPAPPVVPTQPSQPTQPQSVMAEHPTSRICLIGDSRTVQMKNAVNSDAAFICESSMGWAWFQAYATGQFKRIQQDIDLCVVALGVNDVGNVRRNIQDMNRFDGEYPDKICVFATVGPVDETLFKDVSNQEIENFNATMREGLSSRWQIIDLYGYLSGEAFYTWDGLHYSEEDSEKMYNWIMDQVRCRQA